MFSSIISMVIPLLKIVTDSMISTETELFFWQYIHYRWLIPVNIITKCKAEADLAEGEVQERLLTLLCVGDVEEYTDNLFSFCQMFAFMTTGFLAGSDLTL